MTDQGALSWHEDRAAVRFERWIDATIDAVWDAVTTADGLASWLSPATVDLRLGGSVDLDFGEDGLAGGAILQLTPGAMIEFEWGFPGEPDSILRLELSPSEGGTTVVLDHRMLPQDQAVGYGAGWHAHLDQLGDVLSGRPINNWDDRFGELMPVYRQSAEASH